MRSKLEALFGRKRRKPAVAVGSMLARWSANARAARAALGTAASEHRDNACRCYGCTGRRMAARAAGPDAFPIAPSSQPALQDGKPAR